MNKIFFPVGAKLLHEMVTKDAAACCCLCKGYDNLHFIYESLLL